MRMFFAGAESKSVRKVLLECGVKNILVSYYYVKERKVDVSELLDQFENVVMDSGAFTMFSSADGESIDHENYLADYLCEVNKNIGRFFWIANYDVNVLVGHKKVFEWNDVFQNTIESKNQRVCYVTHDFSLPLLNMREYFERYKYVGLSMDQNGKKNNPAYYNKAYQLSKEKRVFTHGFAMTNFVSMTGFPFYTTDSTTYLGGAKYGSTYVWNGAVFETWEFFKKFRRKQLYQQCNKWGINHNDLMDDDIYAVNKFNIYSWLENEKNYNSKTRLKQWWLSEQEKINGFREGNC